MYQNRFCDQEEFSIGVLSDDFLSGYIPSFKPFLLNNFETKTYLPSLSNPVYGRKAVSFGCDIYVLGKYEYNDSLSFKKYSVSTKSWKLLPFLNTIEEDYFYMCSFMQKVFIITDENCDTPSMFYDYQAIRWISITSLVRSVEAAASTVFEGKIIFSGGLKKIALHNGGEGLHVHLYHIQN